MFAMKTVSLCGLLALLCASPAAATPYVGFDGNLYSISLKQSVPEFYPQSAGGVDFYLGDRFRNFAAEIGYGTSSSKGNYNSDPMHLTRISIDGLVHIPVFAGINFLLTAGGVEQNYGFSSFSQTTFVSGGKNHTRDSDITLSHGDEFDWRAGGGFSLEVSPFEVRLLAHYQPLSMNHQSQDALSLNLGINYDL
jgi:hypothetical protein